MNSSEIKRVVITGASGFIGKALLDYFINIGIEVLAVDRKPLEGIQCKSYVLDITIPGILDRLLTDMTVIFHLAAHASVADSVSDPREDFKANMCGLFEILESARKSNSQLIFPSTASIFDTSNTLPLSEKAYVRPTSPYAAAKVSGEAYCNAYHRSYGLDVKIARLFSVYGVGMNRFAIHDLIQKIQENRYELSILGDGNQLRDYLYIDDVVRGLLVIASAGQSGEDYNLASGEPVRLYDLSKQIAKIMGYPDIKIYPTGKSFPGDVPRWYADISKINKIGFAPRVFLDDGLKKTINWLIDRNA